jgi:hypothetical protein
MSVALLTIAILIGTIIYVYQTETARISSLNAAGTNICSQVKSAVLLFYKIVANATETMQGQILQDNSLISALNSTKPSGYSNTVSVLQDQIRQDLAIVSNMNSLTAASSQLSDPCVQFS